VVDIMSLLKRSMEARRADASGEAAAGTTG